MFGPFFHQKALNMAICGGNHLLPSNSHLGQWTSYSQCMWPRVHITDVGVCSMHVSQVEGVYMDPIRVEVHCEANLWQTQRNLVGTGKCKSTNDPGWFPTTPRYLLLKLETQKKGSVFAQKPNIFHPFMGLWSSWWCLLFLGCRWNEWDSRPFHHKDLDTYIALGHALIRLDQAYFYGCHIWYQQYEVPPIHIDGVWFSSHKGASCLGYHESTNMWKLGGVIECPMGKASLAYATFETIMFHYGWCPTITPNIAIGCTFTFYFLLHCLVFWYYISMGIP